MASTARSLRKGIITNESLRLEPKAFLINTHILPIGTYNSATWPILTIRQNQKIQNIPKVIKNILNVKEILHMANTEMVEEVKKQGDKLQNNVLMNKVRDVDSLSENKSFQEENVSN